jgi:UDP-GlcNAc:undecaprenyl-phosphate GlcNAc-1-phosphate transferase
MDQMLFSTLVAFLITLFAIPKIIGVSEKKNLFDNPDAVRKLHDKPISSLGGIGIFLGFIVSILLTGDLFQVQELQYCIASLIVIFFIGIKDDIVSISAFKKFIGQSLVACILMFKAHLLITDMHGFLGLHHIYTSFSFFLTFFTLIVVINAFNLIDGIDGLAASLGLISSLVFGAFFLINGNIPYALIGFGFAGSLIAFLIYNFQPAKIFMGDTGSLLMGVVNSILVIKFIQTGSGYTIFSVAAAPAMGFSILLIPLMDTLRVFGIRILHRRSPFSADRNHIHHLLLDRGLSHKSITLTGAAVSLVFISAAFLLQGIGTTWLIAGLITCFSLIIYGIRRIPVKLPMRIIKSNSDVTDSHNENYASAGRG